jgi:hypothetical protein
MLKRGGGAVSLRGTRKHTAASRSAPRQVGLGTPGTRTGSLHLKLQRTVHASRLDLGKGEPPGPSRFINVCMRNYDQTVRLIIAPFVRHSVSLPLH